jgi:quinolinate synthase
MQETKAKSNPTPYAGTVIPAKSCGANSVNVAKTRFCQTKVTDARANSRTNKTGPGVIANENCNCSECPYMKRNTLEKLRDCLRDLEPRVEIPAAILARAALPIERMLAVK